MSAESLRVVAAMLEDPMAEHYGLRLAENAGISSGTVYPILARLEKAGWLESRWEDQGAEDEGRPRRRLYRLTGLGERAGMSELDEIVRAAQRAKRRRARLKPRQRLV
jgi:DNA-binding PadR family transcriptional regulator